MRASDAARAHRPKRKRAKEGECRVYHHVNTSKHISNESAVARFHSRSLALTRAAASLAQPQGQAGARVLAERLGGDVVEEGKRVTVRPRLRDAHRRLVTHDDVHVAPGAVVRDDRPGTDAEPPRRRTMTTLRG